jgi:formate--tetrahydrofolate ligase
MPYSYDAKISSSVKLKKIQDIAKKYGIARKYITLYGDHIAKVDADSMMKSLKKRKNGKLILVTSITPTHLGEGKTVNTIGLSMAINALKKRSFACIRQPSLGPTFGLKGGAAGGGHSQVLPAEEINLSLTGDSSAATNAQNLCAALLDNSLYWDNPLKIDKDKVTWDRTSEISDRSLRNITIGGGGKLHGVNRKTGIDITEAGECMSVLSLASSLKDLRKRLGNIIVGYDKDGKAILAEDLSASGAMAAILKKAFEPNLLQTIEHTPCFVHTGAFANVSHGSSSVISDLIAMKLSDYTVTESGFGADLGAEKFMDIKCRQTGYSPDVVVINCSVRAFKVHSGDYDFSGTSMPADLKKENLSAVDRGCSNLEKQVENLKIFGIPVVVCINRFDSDTTKEINVIKNRAEALEVEGVGVSDVYKKGSKGIKDLARIVMEAADKKSRLCYLYPTDMTIRNKIERVAKSMYGASEVKYSDQAGEQIKLIEENGLNELPVCIAKAHLSLSNNTAKKGRPRGFKLGVDEVKAYAGAGYIAVKCEGINNMPGFPRKPRASLVDVDTKNSKIKNIV